MKLRLLLTACLSCLVFSASVMAQGPYRSGPHAGYGVPKHRMAQRPQQPQVPADIREASAMLKAGLEKLLGFFEPGQQPSRQLIEAFLNKEIAPYFDFAYMAKYAAGSMGRYLNDKQKRNLQNQLKHEFLGKMAEKLSTFDSQTVRYLKPRRGDQNQLILGISIGNRGSYPARVDFRLYKSASGWKVYDVSANGSSALAYYRQHFSRLLKTQMIRKQQIRR